MEIRVKSAAIEQKQIIFDLLQRYLDELSRFPEETIE
jgi:hypothetical protein